MTAKKPKKRIAKHLTEREKNALFTKQVAAISRNPKPPIFTTDTAKKIVKPKKSTGRDKPEDYRAKLPPSPDDDNTLMGLRSSIENLRTRIESLEWRVRAWDDE